MNNRIYIEKIAAAATESRHLLHDLRESLALNSLENLRIVQRYDVLGLNNAQFSLATSQILSEPQVDLVSHELTLANNETAFGVAYLPGQFDQRADSAAQCIQILTAQDRPTVHSARIIILQGNLSNADISRIKSYVINAVDSHEISPDAPASNTPITPPSDVKILTGMTQMPAPALAELRRQLGLAMTDADFTFCQSYFLNQEQRDPSITEIRVLDTYWSDHCRHTTFLTKLEHVTFGENSQIIQQAWQTYLQTRHNLNRDTKDISLMDIALIGMRELKNSGELDNLEVSEEVNAASIVVPINISHNEQTTTEEWLVMFKNETHNHPTEIEPFGGAATCIGGCIRDPLSGRSYVYQAMRVTGAANPLTPFTETLPGKLPQKTICQVAAHGYSSYGNQIGLATGQVTEVYHPGYLAKRMEIGAVVAAAPRSQVFRGTPAPGDVILLIGGKTGRDGVGGATGSSKEHTETALQNSAEVQKGDAPTERKIQRLFRDSSITKKIKICNDFGAGGVSVAIGEIAPSLDINLDAIPKKYNGLDGTELAISESQERMALCVAPTDAAAITAAAHRENLDCVPVATVANHGRMRMHWNGKTIVDITRAFLDTNGITQTATAHITGISHEKSPLGKTIPTLPTQTSLREKFSHLLRDLNQCSQQGLGERFDASVGAATVLWPFGGKNQITPPDAMVAKIPLLKGETDACTYMSWSFDPTLSSWSPFHGSVYAIAHSVAKLVAAGASLPQTRLTLQEYFPKLGQNPERWGLPLASLLGAYHAQQQLRLAAIGGKDSMSGSFQNLDVPPTLVSFALAPGLAKNATSPEFKQCNSQISLVEISRDTNQLPDFAQMKSICNALHQAIQQGKILALHALGNGGIAAGLAKMAFGNNIGATLNTPLDLFQERYLAFLIEHPSDVKIPNTITIGSTHNTPDLHLSGEIIPLSELRNAWEQTLEPVYPTQTKLQYPAVSIIPPAPQTKISRASASIPRPKVLIPTFPGTNSEYDSARAFERAGGDASILVFRNQNTHQVEDSLKQLAAQIRQSQIIMIPGGFSAGDEPDGSGKFIATVLRNPQVADAIMDLLKNRDGLVLGICNGFQALIKTGLVPYGEIRATDADSPTLTFNDIGRHISRYVTTRIVNAHSPWLQHTTIGDVHRVPLSHGEGKFIAPNSVLQTLITSGQIATQYCDPAGNPSMDIALNPNGSMLAIEGITSPCGRILGKMGHTERNTPELAKNIPATKCPDLFRSGITYFA